MTVLTLSQKVARAADLQILHRNLKTAAQIGKLPDRRQTLFCNFPQHLVPLIHQKGISRPVRASDTSAQLIQLGQSHSVRIVDDDRVDVGNVQTGFDDRRRNQNVDFAVDKAKHDFFQISLRHLSVCKCHIRIRHHFPNLCCHICNRIDAVVYIIHLTIPGQLAGDRLTHHFFIIFHHIGLDRLTFLRRFLQHAHVADTDQRHMQGPWNRRCRQGQHIHVLFHFLDLFLMGHAKALLLVDHQKTKILILHI